MGPVRRWNFDAVIGVGGSRPWTGHEEIANRINWIGVNADKTKPRNPRWRGPLVTFERFLLYKGDQGPKLKTLAPKLFKYMFEEKHVRAVMSQSLNSQMQKEITRILGLAKRHKRLRPFLSDTVLIKNRCCGRRADKSKC
jgi:hypothetical protein